MKIFGAVIPIAILGSTPAAAQPESYSGPAVLSRGGDSDMPASPIAFRPFVNASALYTGGLASGTVGPDGRLSHRNTYGVEAAAGVYGFHTWKHTIVGLNYRGDYRQYSRGTTFDTTNHLLSFGVSHEVNRKLTVSLRQGAGSFSQNYGYLGSFGFFDPTFAQIPRDEMFDTRTHYFTTMADATYVRSPRLSFNVGGTGFTVRRETKALYGVTGASARVDTAYRLTRSTTIGGDYFFSHFSFTKSFGDANLHSVGFNYSVQFSRLWQLALRGGLVRVETLSLGRVEVDPVIAAITGQRQALRAFHEVRIQPAAAAQLSRRFRNASASINGQYGASPGNGIYLTSRQATVFGQYSYTGLRKWSLAALVGFSDLQSIGQDISRYRSVTAGGSVTRGLGRQNFFATARWDARRITAGQSFGRTYYTASVGVAYSPGDIPLRLW